MEGEDSTVTSVFPSFVFCTGFQEIPGGHPVQTEKAQSRPASPGEFLGRTSPLMHPASTLQPSDAFGILHPAENPV